MKQQEILQLHNAMWPGIVGKGEGAVEPDISLDQMLELTKQTRVNGQGFDGIDLNLMEPHFDIDSSKEAILAFADRVSESGLHIGTVGAPIWPTVGGGSAMGSQTERKRFLKMIKKTCEYTAVLNQHGVRQYGSIRIDSADSPVHWAENPQQNTKLIAQTFKEAGKIASDFGERLAAEGEICWAGMHSWKDMLNLLEAIGMPGQVGFQADLAHTYLYLLGYNAPEHALLGEKYTEDEFWEAYENMTRALAPWTIDFHVAQSDGSVFGSGSHDKTGRHCLPNDPEGKLDVVRCARYWLIDDEGHIRNNIHHICWDGCMFPNAVLKSPQNWQKVLILMQQVRDDIEKQLKRTIRE